jgi:hypothetical protein
MLDPSFRWGPYEYFRPIVAAELARANPCDSFPFGDGIHDTRPYVRFRWPIDVAAIGVEFDLDNGMALETAPRPRVTYSNRLGGPYEVLGGADVALGPEQVVARAAWWAEWNDAPRPKIGLINPFLNLRRDEPVHQGGHGRAKRERG